eukprot:TRINITY_DN3179_c0_g1_i1.p1 TRINITY_DN3179_c0_g1~~TRINITY_DN3179_c0_g1_i1.p1  ORF type:complete len:310 (+),score=123.41 TRINITY_DN3179_c0_g1_i1:60-932(+)
MFSKKKKEVKKTAEEIAKETGQLGQWYEERKEERKAEGGESKTLKEMEEEAARNVAKYQDMDLLDSSLLSHAQRIQALSSRMALLEEENRPSPYNEKDLDLLASLDLDSSVSLDPSDLLDPRVARTYSQAAKTLGLVGETSIDDLDIAKDLWDSPDSDPLFSSLSRPRVPNPNANTNISTSSSASSRKVVDFGDLFGEEEVEGTRTETTVVEVRRVPREDTDKDRETKDRREREKGPVVSETRLLSGKEESSGDYFGSQSDILSSTDSSLSDLSFYLASNASFLSFSFDD